jgi:hypothetical protein
MYRGACLSDDNIPVSAANDDRSLEAHTYSQSIRRYIEDSMGDSRYFQG